MSSFRLGGFFMASMSGGLKDSAVAGGPSVTRFTQSSCTGIKPSGMPNAAVKKIDATSPMLEEMRYLGRRDDDQWGNETILEEIRYMGRRDARMCGRRILSPPRQCINRNNNLLGNTAASIVATYSDDFRLYCSPRPYRRFLC